MGFQEIKPTDLPGNAIDEICNRWMLLSAGTEKDFNFMTVNWGMMGELWFRPAVTVYVRHSRHTLGYMENNECFTLTVLKEGHGDALKIAGSKSGRHIDKVKETGLTPVFVDDCPTFAEAEYTLVCKKMYAADMPPENFLDKDAFARSYTDPDYHKMYVGEIIKAYINQ